MRSLPSGIPFRNSSGALIAVDSELAYVRALHRPSDAAAATVPP